MTEMADDVLEQALGRVQAWVEARDYRGYDPGDGLTSWLRPLTFGNQFAERVLQQVIWKSPVNLRPLAGIRPLDSTKGRGFMAWGYLLVHARTGEPAALERARECLAWLDDHRAAGQPGHSWGNAFDFTTRSGTIRAGEPTIVWSGLIGQAFLEAWERTGEERWLEVARGVCDWILTLPREVTATGHCLSYIPSRQSSIHNSNMLGAAMLARTWKHVRRAEYLEVAREAMRYSCTRQLDDGAWYYGEEAKYHWIDNFHTGYNLDSLKRYAEATGDESFRGHLERGYRYFKEVFFEEAGRPRYYHDNTWPVDIQCAGQAIDTFAFFSDLDPGALDMAGKVACWTVANMQDPSGYFHYRLYPRLRARTPYFHWGQATMFKGLAHLLLQRSRRLPTQAAATGPALPAAAP